MGPLTIATSLSLAAFGAGAVWLGIWVLRNAERVVGSARRQLVDMFGEQFPGLAEERPDPLGARIAGVGFVIVGAALLVGAVFTALA
ncbi:MAG TPA: hypothetical protein VN200_03445 [Rhodoglobus sp.]|nr:hypothetical protein [Rhodoglobus sp.]